MKSKNRKRNLPPINTDKRRWKYSQNRRAGTPGHSSSAGLSLAPIFSALSNSTRIDPTPRPKQKVRRPRCEAQTPLPVESRRVALITVHHRSSPFIAGSVFLGEEKKVQLVMNSDGR
jgi:hypothetical protein